MSKRSKSNSKLIDILNKEYSMDDQIARPILLLSVYKGPESLFLEVADVSEQGTIGNFRPMGQELANELGEELLAKKKEEEKIVDGYVPDTLRYFAYNRGRLHKLLWHTRPQVKYLTFGDPDENIKNGNLRIPYIIWVYHQGSLYLYACLEEPTPKTKLYHAPFFNIAADGRVCTGSGTHHMKGNTLIQLTTNAEKVFWDTKFTYPHNTLMLRTTKELLKPTYKKRIGSNRLFKEKDLSPFTIFFKPKDKRKKQLTYGTLLNRFPTS